MRGYAISGGGNGVIRVDVSLDGGETWAPATLQKHPDVKPGRTWSWVLWEATLPVPEGAKGPFQLTCKVRTGGRQGIMA